MKHTLTRRCLFSLVTVLAAGCSSSEPAPERAAPAAELERVLAAVEARFRNAESITVETLVNVGAEGPRNFLRTTWAEPGLFREERWDGEKAEGTPSSLQISDGTTSWLYFSAQKKYYEMAISPGDLDRKPFIMGFTREGRLAVAGIEAGREEELVFGAGCLCMPIAGGGKLALAPDEEVAGTACRVITYSVGTMVQTFYVSKADGTPVRFTLESHSEHKGKTYTTSAVSAAIRVDTAARSDAALFRWAVPEGATKAAKAGEDKLLAAGGVAPELGAVDAEGKPVSLSDFKGKVVLLNFWFLG
jgi:outer membrane lipoprotein-sorting protein